MTGIHNDADTWTVENVKLGAQSQSPEYGWESVFRFRFLYFMVDGSAPNCLRSASRSRPLAIPFILSFTLGLPARKYIHINIERRDSRSEGPKRTIVHTTGSFQASS